jgi:hypothetical protein
VKYDPKEHANWLVNRGVSTDKLVCPMCNEGDLRYAMRPGFIWHIDPEGEPQVDPETRQRIGVITAPIACGNCGYLRLFVLDVDDLPEPRQDMP